MVARERPGSRRSQPGSQESDSLIALFKQGRYTELVSAAEDAIRKHPRFAGGWKLLGAAYSQLGRNQDALTPMRKAVKLLEDDAEAHKNLGIILKALGRLSEAENSFRRALRINPEAADVHNNLGIILLETARLKDAESSCRRAVQINPEFAEAHNNLGIVLMEMGHLQDAEASCRTSLQLQPGFAAAYGNLGTVLQAMGRLDEALECFRQRARLTPGNAVDQHLITSLSGGNSERAPADYVQDVFDAYAPKFDSHLQGALQYDVPKKLRELISRNPPNIEKWDVLDLGCGTGLAGLEIAPFSKRLVGVDLSAKMLEQAQSRMFYQRLERSDLLPMMQLEAPASYDLIIAADVFVYLGDLDSVIAEARRLLSPGGRFAFSVEAGGETVERELTEQKYHLKNTGRYGHSLVYLERLAETNGYRILDTLATQIRLDRGQPIMGYVCLWGVPTSIDGSSGSERDTEQLLQAASSSDRTGQSQIAERRYREVLQTRPDHAETNHSLGTLYVRNGRTADSLPFFAKALEGEPAQGQYWLSYIDALLRTGQAGEAQRVMGFGRECGLVGTDVDELAQRVDDAVAGAKAMPTDPEMLAQRCFELQDRGNLDEAERCYRRLVQLVPGSAAHHCNLGSLLQQMGRLDDALDSFERALSLDSGIAGIHFNYGNALRQNGLLAEAADSYRHALRLMPDYVSACCNLAVVLLNLGRAGDAEVMLRRALELEPNSCQAHGNLGIVLHELGRLSEAEASYRSALQHESGLAEVHNDLGILLQDMGRLDESEACYRHALQLKPDYYKAHSNLLFLLNYNPDVTPETAFDEARRYGAAVAAAAVPFIGWSCAEQPQRLRIGFVSGDFRNHPVGYFLENLLQHVDRDAFELYAYPTDPWSDEHTQRIKRSFAAWKPLYGLNDEAAARLIHDDGVHILIDLSGHSRHNRLPVFVWKPAPVQVTWLGYFATTGLAEMDYLIADPTTLPESQERYFTEKIMRLPETRLCFNRPGVAIEVSMLPALENGYITFGCFNNLAKMNDDVVALWSRVLLAVPRSRLFLKSKQLGDDVVRQHTVERFAVHGVAAERLMLEGAESREKYFEAYHRVDIALDPFPYPGGTITVECLWMGVPVLSLSGQSFLFRQGAGFLINAGLQEWVAVSQDDYAAKAGAFAGDLTVLVELRVILRRQVERSPIMDGVRFAGNFARVLQRMWTEIQSK